MTTGGTGVFIFARFLARAGCEKAVYDAIREVVPPSREESGCRSIHAFRSLRAPRLFYIHSRWEDERAFELHATLPHTRRFIERVETLVDHPLDAVRTERIG